MFTDVVCLVAKKKKKTQISTNRRMDMFWYLPTIEYSAAMKMSESSLFATE